MVAANSTPWSFKIQNAFGEVKTFNGTSISHKLQEGRNKLRFAQKIFLFPFHCSMYTTGSAMFEYLEPQNAETFGKFICLKNQYFLLVNDARPVFFCDSVVFCLLYTSPSPRDRQKSRMPSSA